MHSSGCSWHAREPNSKCIDPIHQGTHFLILVQGGATTAPPQEETGSLMRPLGTKFHELPILLIFGLGLQIIIIIHYFFIILATKARHVNLIDTTGGRGPCSVYYVASLALMAKIIKCTGIMIWSPRPSIANIQFSLVGREHGSRGSMFRTSCSEHVPNMFRTSRIAISTPKSPYGMSLRPQIC